MPQDEKDNIPPGENEAALSSEKDEAGSENIKAEETNSDQKGSGQESPNIDNENVSQSVSDTQNQEQVKETEQPAQNQPVTQKLQNEKSGASAGLARKQKKSDDKDVLYFAGCTASFDINVKDVGINTVNILDALGIKFGILGNEEKCCGSIALRIGDYPEFVRLAENNIKTFNSLGVKTFITSCSGCYKTVKHDYKKIGNLDMEVYHTSEFLAKLIKENKIDLKHEVPVKITYHDPCHMGRHSNVYDTPREVLKAIPGLEFIEMERSGKYSRCCGAGGGLKAGYPDTQNLMAQDRVKDAEEVEVDWFVTTCPFCYQGLQIGINAIQSDLKMKDITEVVAIAMGIKPFEK